MRSRDLLLLEVLAIGLFLFVAAAVPVAADGDLFVNTSRSLAAGNYSYGNVTVTNGAVLTLLSNTSVPGFKGVNITAVNLTVEAGSSISADGNGYGQGSGPGASTTPLFRAGGAGYGGAGGTCDSAGGQPYGSAVSPLDLGSGGGGSSYAQQPGGPGGGAILIVLNGTLINNGRISANAPATSCGGGSGGSVFVITNFLSGNGLFAADGGNSSTAGGGGGGRIAIRYTYSNFTGQLSASQGTGISPGYNGTSCLFDTVSNTLTTGSFWRFEPVDGPDFRYSGIDLTGCHGLVAGANTTVQISGNIAMAGFNASLATGAVLHSDQDLALSGSVVTSGAGSRLEAYDLAIDPSSRITADGLGYGSGSGPGAGSGYQYRGSGGGYGGKGGNANGASGGSSYGTPWIPTLFGSGGGRSPYYQVNGGAGGGTVRLVANGTLTNNGNVTSNGVSTNGPGGGGSGGSIWVTTGVLAGNGTFAANGGNSNGGGGGGGRIAMNYQASAFTGRITATGGTTSTAGDENGADGTVVHTYNMVYPNPVKRVAGVEIQVYGTGFVPEMTLHLEKNGVTAVTAGEVFTASPEMITARLDLSGVPADTYEVVLGWPDAHTVNMGAVLSVSDTTPGTIFEDDYVSIDAGGIYTHSIEVGAADNLFAALRKTNVPGEIHRSWAGSLTLTRDGTEVARAEGDQDLLVQVEDPEPGTYTITIHAGEQGTGILTAGSQLPAMPYERWIVDTIYRQYGSVFHQVTVPANATTLRFDAQAMGTWSRYTVFFGRYGNTTRWMGSSGPVSDLVIPNPLPGIYIVEFTDTQMISGDGGQERDVMLRASITSGAVPAVNNTPFISKVTPDTGGLNGTVTMTISGGWLRENATVSLAGEGGTDIVPVRTSYSGDGSGITAEFDLRGRSAGNYSVVVTNPDGGSVTSQKAFATTTAKGSLGIGILGREQIRENFASTYRFDTENTGNINIPSPALRIGSDPPSANVQVRMRESGEWVPLSEPIILFPTGGKENPGTLVPGLSDGLEMDLRTSGIDSFSLYAEPVFQDSLPRITSVGMTADATILASSGPFFFARYCLAQPSEHIGSFGRCWVNPFDIRLSENEQGYITLVSGDEIDAVFVPVTSTLYTSLTPNDTKSLSIEGGFYILKNLFPLDCQFDSEGRLVGMADENGPVLGFDHDGEGRLTKIWDVNLNWAEIALTYSPAGRIVTVTAPGRDASDPDIETTYSYDPTGMFLTQVTAPEDLVTRYTYDSDGTNWWLASIALPTGSTVNYQYSTSSGLLEQVSTNTGMDPVRFSYDKENSATTVNSGSASIRYMLDSNGHLGSLRDPLGEETTFSYDYSGRMTSICDQRGDTLTFDYNAIGQVTRVRDPLGGETITAYHPVTSYPTNVISANGNSLSFNYSADGNPTQVLYPDATHVDFTPDSEGRLSSVRDRDGGVFTYTYNEQNLITRVTMPNKTISSTYNRAGDLLTLDDGNGQISYEYGSHGELLNVTYPDGTWFGFTYDPESLTFTEQSDGFSLSYHATADGRLLSVSNADLGIIKEYNYYPTGLLKRETYANGAYVQYTYDSAGRLITLENHNYDGSFLSRYVIEYNAVGCPVRIETIDGTYYYDYDANGRIIRCEDPDSTVTAYTYDADGNRVTETRTSESPVGYTTNALDQYTVMGTTSFIYDTRGNLVTRTENGTTTVYEYDGDGRLTNVTRSDGDTWQYSYSADGNRDQVIHNGVEHNYDVKPIGLGYTVAEYNANRTLLNRYIYGTGLAAVINANGTLYQYFYDPSGNTVQITDQAGIVVNSYRYSPFGEIEAIREDVANPFRFGGEYGIIDDVNGLLYFRNRYYMPDTGKFTSEDPVFTPGFNPYTYCANNPLVCIDPSGKSEIKQAWRDTGVNLALAIIPGLPRNGLHCSKWVQSNILKHCKDLGKGAMMGMNFASKAQWGFQKLQTWMDLETVLDLKIASLQSAASVTSHQDLNYGGGFHTIGLVGGNFLGMCPFLPAKLISVLIPVLDEGSKEYFTWTEEARWVVEPEHGCLWDLRKVHLSKMIHAKAPVDPEDMFGPAGFDHPGETKHWVTPDTEFAYRTDIWNKENATAWVYAIYANDTLDPGLNRSTFSFTETGLLDWTVPLDPPCPYFDVYMNISDRKPDTIVHVTGSLNQSDGRISMVWDSLNATTLQPVDPADPEAGFLPANVNGTDIAWFSYRVEAKPGLATGTGITNRAWVSFDDIAGPYNPAPPGGDWVNTIDGAPPVSSASAAVQNGTGIVFTLSGNDQGSGIGSYTVYVSDNGGDYLPWLTGVTGTNATSPGVPGHSYRYYSRATDNVGNREAEKSVPDGTVQVPVLPEAPLAWFSGSPVSGNAPLDVTFTDGSENDPSEWCWNFGDGPDWVNGTGQNVTHRYTAAGNYTATLVARNAAGEDLTTRKIQVGVPAPVVYRITPKSGARGKTVAVTNLSGNYFQDGAKVRLARGGKTIAGKAVDVTGPARIRCKFRIPATAKTGKWNVNVTNPDGQSALLTNGFRVTA